MGVKVSKGHLSKTKSSVKDATHKLQETQLGCASVVCRPRGYRMSHCVTGGCCHWVGCPRLPHATDSQLTMATTTVAELANTRFLSRSSRQGLRNKWTVRISLKCVEIALRTPP